MMMNNSNRSVAMLTTLITAFAVASPTFGQTYVSQGESARQINAANQLLRDGEIDLAIERYGEVVADESSRDELNYNMAVAQYRKSDFQAAASLFSETAGSIDANMAARSRYNLGNCLYATALQTAEQDKPTAIEQLRQAISHYRGSLRVISDNNDARANIELAAELIRKLEEEKEQEEQQQQDQQNQDQQNPNDQQQNQEAQNQDSESQDSQSDQSQTEGKDSQSNESDQQREQSDSSDSEESNNENSEQQESANNDSEQSSQTQNESEQQPKSDLQDSANRQSAGDQREDHNQSKESQQLQDDSNVEENKSENQSTPTGELTAADEQNEKESAGSVAMADPNAKDGAMTKEEALKMLQAVRDRDMVRRLRQQQRERLRHVPVERDW